MAEFDIGNLNLEADLLPPPADWAGHLGMGVRTEEEDATAHLDMEDLAQHVFLQQAERVRNERPVETDVAKVLKDSSLAVSGAIAEVIVNGGVDSVRLAMDKLVPRETPRRLMAYPNRNSRV